MKGAAKRGEAIQALEDALGVLEAAANLVLANGNPVDNEGDQINTSRQPRRRRGGEPVQPDHD